MSYLFEQDKRDEMIGRVNELTNDSMAQWGSMSVENMLAHLVDTFQVTFCEKECEMKKGFMSTKLGRMLVLSLPIPKGKLDSPGVFLETGNITLSEGKERIIAYIEKFSVGPEQKWGHSPLFGKMTAKDWAKLHYVHLDHHLSQFGV